MKFDTFRRLEKNLQETVIFKVDNHYPDLDVTLGILMFLAWLKTEVNVKHFCVFKTYTHLF